jgi:glycerol-3-phosphate dehydrogenase (NAD(P)+)
MQKLTIVGAGAWGTALAYIFRNTDYDITLWSKNPDTVAEINNHHTNSKYTEKADLTGIKATGDLQKSLAEASIIINALPSYTIREIYQNSKNYIKEGVILINASKGTDTQKHQMPHQIFNEIFSSSIHYYSLSGPGFSSGLLESHPTTINIAGKTHNKIKDIKDSVKANNVYLSYSSDIVGVEWGGIYKNIVAIASGFARGLGYGENTNALIFSAGFKEMVQSGIAQGANLETFYEPSGVGDLMLSTSSMKSRNYSFGYHLAKGEDIESIFSKLAGVSEGYYSLKSISHLKKEYELSLPLSSMLSGIIFHHENHKSAFNNFLNTNFT